MSELSASGAAPIADAVRATGDASPGTFRRLIGSTVGFLTTAWLLLIAFVAIFGRLLTPFDPEQTDARNALLPPLTDGHLLGTDDAGRDMLSRLIVSSQTSMLAVVLTVGIAVLVGVTAGLLAGYFGGWFDQVSNWVVNMLMAMPGLVLLLAARSVLGPSILIAMALLGIIIAPTFYRLVSTAVRGVRNELYVDAARVTGISDARIIRRHILRVVRGPIIIQASIVSSVAIAVLAGLAIIGFGGIENPSWGTLLQAGFARIFRTQWLLLWPALVIALTSLSFALLGNQLRDDLEGGARARKPRRRNRKARAGSSADVAAADDDVDAPAATIEHPLDGPVDTLLSVRGLVVGYPGDVAGEWTRVVRGIDLDIGRGEVLGLVGESGSGKTQSAFAVMGLLSIGGEILEGSVVFDGEELVGDAKAVQAVRGRRIAYVPQEPMSNLDPSFTVGSQLVEPMRVCLGLDKKTARARALELLAMVEIPDPQRVFDSYPHQLSGGMAQRVLIAGAVASEPELIIADEPTTALDVTVQAEILDLLRNLQRDTGTALLLVTHNFGVVADLADRVSVMQHGRIVETGPVRAIFDDARHPYTRSLMDAILDNQPARAAYRPPMGVMAEPSIASDTEVPA